MADLKLNEQTGDLDVGADGDLSLVDGIDAIRQHLKIRLQFFRGEWFLDTRLGVPYFEEILRKSPDLNVVQSLFRDVIRTTPGVVEITEFALDYEGTTRTLSLDFRALTTDGPLQFTEDFVIPAPAG
jgi:hypothetical protein